MALQAPVRARPPACALHPPSLPRAEPLAEPRRAVGTPRRFPDVAARYDVKLGDSVGHAVPAGDLAFSVTIFCLCAATCISILAWRRATYGAELGAGGRWPTFACFVSLWFLYVLMSSLRTYGHVPGFR